MTTLRLFGLSQSPWTERARWALDHHHIAYQMVVHTPFLGEARLRRVANHPARRVTVPLLVGDGVLLSDSWDIARYADVHGHGVTLFPQDALDFITHCGALAERGLAAKRILVTRALLHNGPALDELVPGFVPRALAPLVRPVGRFGTHWFARKHGLALDDGAVDAAHAALRATLVEARAYVSGKTTPVRDAFNYADILLATLVHAVSPVTHARMPIGAGTRVLWHDDALATDFADLVAWRDAIYAAYRVPAAA